MSKFGTPPAGQICECKWYRRFWMEVSKDADNYYWAWGLTTEVNCGDALGGSCNWDTWTHLGSGSQMGGKSTFYHIALVKCDECECDAGVGSYDYSSDHGFSSFDALPECFRTIWLLTGSFRPKGSHDKIEACMKDFLKNSAIPGEDMSIPPTDSEMKDLCGKKASQF